MICTDGYDECGSRPSELEAKCNYVPNAGEGFCGQTRQLYSRLLLLLWSIYPIQRGHRTMGLADWYTSQIPPSGDYTPCFHSIPW